jgi:ABC-type multidrug transport system permease subunit
MSTSQDVKITKVVHSSNSETFNVSTSSPADIPDASLLGWVLGLLIAAFSFIVVLGVTGSFLAAFFGAFMSLALVPYIPWLLIFGAGILALMNFGLLMKIIICIVTVVFGLLLWAQAHRGGRNA